MSTSSAHGEPAHRLPVRWKEGGAWGRQSLWGPGYRGLSEGHFLYLVANPSSAYLSINPPGFCHPLSPPTDPLIRDPPAMPQVTSSDPTSREPTSTSWLGCSMTGRTRTPHECWGGSVMRTGGVIGVTWIRGVSWGSHMGHRFHGVTDHLGVTVGSHGL